MTTQPARMRFAVITTHNRPEDYQDCVAAITPQVDVVFTVCHIPGDDAPEYIKKILGEETTYVYSNRLPNISAMWNIGLDAAHLHTPSRFYDVAVLNDDAIVPDMWFNNVTHGMRWHNSSVGCVRRDADPRMSGYAFILDGRSQIRADEQFQWWYGDDDIARQAERKGGITFTPGSQVEHRHPNSTTIGELAAIAQDDRHRYRRKWHAR